MRASLRNIQRIEHYLNSQLSATDLANFKQQLLLEPQLYDHLQKQKFTYQLIHRRGRQQLRQELNEIHTTLFTTPDNRTWQMKILAFFRKS